jgi:hypothetical protein
MNHLLTPLRIPGGWAVTYNVYFADVPMKVQDGRIVNFECFKEDLLMIQQLHVADGRHEIDHSGWLLDVGWYPDSDPSGAYTLTLVRGSWTDQVVFRVRDRNVETVRAAIERILDGLSHGEDVSRLRDAIGASWATGMPEGFRGC